MASRRHCRRLAERMPADLTEIRAELGQLRGEVQAQVAELQERLDFAERLLAQRVERSLLDAENSTPT